MKDFNIVKVKKDIDINIQSSKKQALKMFLKQYKLISFFAVILLAVLGLRIEKANLMSQIQSLFIVIVYFMFMLFKIFRDSWQVVIKDSKVYISIFFNQYTFDIMDFLSIKLDTKITDNQQEGNYDDHLDLYDYDERKNEIQAKLILDPIINLIKKFRKVEIQTFYIIVEFLYNERLVKLRLPYKRIKTVNSSSEIYRYVSENDIDELLSSFQYTGSVNNNNLYIDIRSKEREREIQIEIQEQIENYKMKQKNITVSKNDGVLLIILVIVVAVICYFAGYGGF